MKYGQFCPISKAAEILGERWTILLVRELLTGVRRFNQIQRGLGDISPALLASRLKSFESRGLVVRRRISGKGGYEYYPTPACEAFKPVLMAVGEWGLRWARETLQQGDFDPELLMLYLKGSIDPAQLPAEETVVQFKFTDLTEQKDWWLLVNRNAVDVRITSPGRDVDVLLTTTVRTMHEVWIGDQSYREAVSSGALMVEGDPGLTRRIGSWLRPSAIAGSKRTPLPELMSTFSLRGHEISSV